MQIDNILILINNNFHSIKKNAIRSAKIITKNRKYITFLYSLKFNSVKIKLNLNRIVSIKNNYIKKFC